MFALSKETTQWSLADLQVQAGRLCLRQEKLLLAFSGTKLTVGSVRVLEGQEMSLQIQLLEGGCREQCTHASCINMATVITR